MWWWKSSIFGSSRAQAAHYLFPLGVAMIEKSLSTPTEQKVLSKEEGVKETGEVLWTMEDCPPMGPCVSQGDLWDGASRGHLIERLKWVGTWKDTFLVLMRPRPMSSTEIERTWDTGRRQMWLFNETSGRHTLWSEWNHASEIENPDPHQWGHFMGRRACWPSIHKALSTWGQTWVLRKNSTCS